MVTLVNEYEQRRYLGDATGVVSDRAVDVVVVDVTVVVVVAFVVVIAISGSCCCCLKRLTWVDNGNEQRRYLGNAAGVVRD